MDHAIQTTMSQQEQTPPRAEAEAAADRRSEAGKPDAVPDAQPADPAPDLTTLLQKAEAEVAGLRDAWLRAKADAENLRKQAQSDLARAHKYAIEKFAEDLLPVKDALEHALAVETATTEQLRAGVELTLKQLVAVFARVQLTEVDPAGQKFDPHQHQAMAMVDSDQPPSTVVQVLQKGYRLADRILRPALVAVAKSKDAASD
jgi:molecular chaperone GrpE